MMNDMEITLTRLNSKGAVEKLSLRSDGIYRHGVIVDDVEKSLRLFLDSAEIPNMTFNVFGREIVSVDSSGRVILYDKVVEEYALALKFVLFVAHTIVCNYRSGFNENLITEIEEKEEE